MKQADERRRKAARSRRDVTQTQSRRRSSSRCKEVIHSELSGGVDEEGGETPGGNVALQLNLQETAGDLHAHLMFRRIKHQEEEEGEADDGDYRDRSERGNRRRRGQENIMLRVVLPCIFFMIPERQTAASWGKETGRTGEQSGRPPRKRSSEGDCIMSLMKGAKSPADHLDATPSGPTTAAASRGGSGVRL